MSTGFANPPRVLSKRQIIWTMGGIMLAMLLASLDQTIVGPAMPRIVAELGGFHQYAWVTSIYMITSAVTIPIVGKLTDMYGRKPFYIIGIAFFVVFSLGCGLSQSMTQLIVFRGFQGIGAGIMMANAFIVIGDLFAPAERGKYQGFLSAVWGFSSVVGPTTGGFLTEQLSWHWVFFINVPLGLIVIALFLKFFPDIRPDYSKHTVDYPGLIVLILMVVPAMLALSWGGVQYPWVSPQITGMLIFSAVMLALFIFLEMRAKEPLIPLSMFKNNVVAISNIISFFIGMGMFGAIMFIPLFYQGILGTTPTASGNMMIPMSMMVTAASFGAGQILARSGGRYKILGIVGTAFVCLGVFLLSRMNADTPYWQVIVNSMVVGIGMGATMPVFTIAIQNAVPYQLLGVATSSNTFIRSFGGAVGLAILGSVMNNRFFNGFIGQIPESIKEVVSMQWLTDLAHNPQALVDPAAQEQLREMISQAGASPEVFDQLMELLRHSLSSGVTQAFTLAFSVLVLALIATFFLKEVKLQKQNRTRGPLPAGGQPKPEDRKVR
ncbi:MAG TPA: MDR family MFS transporter [Dehalococcoidales bacterium]|nr:MDR family MFS transporter [Dehalococcoidales bacterium]